MALKLFTKIKSAADRIEAAARKAAVFLSDTLDARDYFFFAGLIFVYAGLHDVAPWMAKTAVGLFLILPGLGLLRK